MDHFLIACRATNSLRFFLSLVGHSQIIWNDLRSIYNLAVQRWRLKESWHVMNTIRVLSRIYSILPGFLQEWNHVWNIGLFTAQIMTGICNLGVAISILKLNDNIMMYRNVSPMPVVVYQLAHKTFQISAFSISSWAWAKDGARMAKRGMIANKSIFSYSSALTSNWDIPGLVRTNSSTRPCYNGHHHQNTRVHILTIFRPEFWIPWNFQSFSPESVPMTFWSPFFITKWYVIQPQIDPTWSRHVKKGCFRPNSML